MKIGFQRPVLPRIMVSVALAVVIWWSFETSQTVGIDDGRLVVLPADASIPGFYIINGVLSVAIVVLLFYPLQGLGRVGSSTAEANEAPPPPPNLSTTNSGVLWESRGFIGDYVRNGGWIMTIIIVSVPSILIVFNVTTLARGLWVGAGVLLLLVVDVLKNLFMLPRKIAIGRDELAVHYWLQSPRIRRVDCIESVDLKREAIHFRTGTTSGFVLPLKHLLAVERSSIQAEVQQVAAGNVR